MTIILVLGAILLILLFFFLYTCLMVILSLLDSKRWNGQKEDMMIGELKAEDYFLLMNIYG